MTEEENEALLTAEVRNKVVVLTGGSRGLGTVASLSSDEHALKTGDIGVELVGLLDDDAQKARRPA